MWEWKGVYILYIKGEKAKKLDKGEETQHFFQTFLWNETQKNEIKYFGGYESSKTVLSFFAFVEFLRLFPLYIEYIDPLPFPQLI